MAEHPIACNVQGDYGYKIIVVDESNTISEIIEKAAQQVVGYLIPEFPKGTVLEARVHGVDEPLKIDITVKEANLLQMEAIDISIRS